MSDEEFQAFMSPERVAERDRALTELVRISEEAGGYDEDFRPVLPPHANAEVHKHIMADFLTMTREEFIQSLVDAGIVSPAGELTEHYRDEGDAP